MPYTATQLTTFYTQANSGIAPDAATTLLLQAYASQNQNGTLTDAQTLSTILHIHPNDASVINSPQSTTDVALATYQFFSGVANQGQGTAPTQAGVQYLVNSPANPTDLHDAYYAGFNQANRYINFSVNLATGAGQYAADFAAAYSSLTFAQTVSTAYEQIVGTINVGPTAAAAAIAAITAQQGYFTQFVAQYAPGANQDLAIKAAVIGYILEEGIKGDVGTYAKAIDGFHTALALTGTAEYGANLLAVYAGAPQTQANQVLTTGIDNLQGSSKVTNFIGSLTPFNVDGKGPTLNPGDNIAGGASGTVNNLVIFDDYASAATVLPAGVTISNIQNVTLNTAGNAGNSAVFDVTSIADVQTVTINSGSAGTDNVKAGVATSVTVNHQSPNGGTVQTFGGKDVSVNATSGTVNVGRSTLGGANPTGAVKVVDQGDGNVTVLGGTTVDLSLSGTSIATVGVNGVVSFASEPTGAVTINETGTGAQGQLRIFGGTDATVNTNGDIVTIGADTNNVIYSATGNIVVNNNNTTSPFTHSFLTNGTSNTSTTGTAASISVMGGKNVTITTNTGSVRVGNNGFAGSLADANQNPSGDVSVVDTSVASGSTVTVFGGANVNVQAAGTAVAIGNLAGVNLVAPTGAITVVDNSPQTYDRVLSTNPGAVTVLGGTDVSVTSNSGAVTIGNAAGAQGNATGAITVVDTAQAGLNQSPVQVFGGGSVSVSSMGGRVIVGNGTAATNTTGAVKVTQAGVETGHGGQFNSTVNVNGGNGVTVNTTGGNVRAGLISTAGTAVSGAVNITDTFVGPNADTFAVWGGTTVNVTTTATSGSIDIGAAAPVLNSAGNGLSNIQNYATGDVTIVNKSVGGSAAAGAKDIYGTGTATVFTNGAKTVSIAGASGASQILDVQTTQSAGKAIGVSALTTVNLEAVQGTAAITSDALTNLNVSNGTAALAVTVTDVAAHSLAVALNNSSKAVTVNDASATAFTVSGTGAAKETLILNAASAKSLAFSNDAQVTLGASGIGSVTTITATGTGTLNLGDLSLNAKLSSIDVSGATGAVSATIDGNTTNFKGGTGVDTLTVVSNGLGGSIVAGSSTSDTLIANYAAAGTDTQAFSTFKGFEIFQIGAKGDSALGAYDATGFSTLAVGAVSGAIVFSNVAKNTALKIIDNPGFGITYTLKDANLANKDSIQVSIGKAATPINATVTLKDGNAGAGVTNLKVDSSGAANTLHFIDVNKAGSGPGAAATQLNITGSTKVTVTYDVDATNPNYTANPDHGSNITKIDASASTSSVVDVTGVALSHAGATITGGAGVLKAAGGLFTDSIDNFVTGSGGGVITVGHGGGWNDISNAYDNGSETINLTASVAVSDTIVLNDDAVSGPVSTFNGSKGGVTAFQVTTNQATSDTIRFGNAKTALTNAPTLVNLTTVDPGFAYAGAIEASLPAALANLAYTSANGVITFSATGIHTLSEFTTAQLIAAAEVIVARAGTDIVATFVSNGSTYVVASGHASAVIDTTHNPSEVVQLRGVASVGGFGGTAAVDTIQANVTNLAATSANSGSAASRVYDDTGFSLETGARFGTTSTTFNNLAASAVVNVTANVGGTITTNQVGAAGSNSETINLLGNNSLAGLKINGDNAVILDSSGATNAVTALTDGTATLASITLTGNAALTIGALNASALKTFDASAHTGGLTLGAIAAPVSQAGLVLLADQGNNTVVASGAGDNITVASVAPRTANDIFTVNGGGVTVNYTGTIAGSHEIVATGTGNTFTLEGGQNIVSGKLGGLAALGANSTINLQDAGGNLSQSIVWVGGSSTVNLTGSAFFGSTSYAGNNFAQIIVGGALANGNSSNASFTTISGASGAHLDLTYQNFGANGPEFMAGGGGTFGNSFVNVSGATSLAQALDIAVNQALIYDGQGPHNGTSVSNGVLVEQANRGLLDWFQYGGDTYIVEVNNFGPDAAHTALGAADHVVKLVGLIDLSNAQFGTFGVNPQSNTLHIG